MLKRFGKSRVQIASLLFFFVFAGVGRTTIVPPITFHELVAKSDQIVTGRVVGKKISWGSEHKFVWTRYEVAVDDVIKGPRQKTVIVSEPGGTLDGVTMRIAGAVAYATGEHVTLFLETYPTGDKRTVGWGQGKLSFDTNGKALPGSFHDLNGLTRPEILGRIRAELLTAGPR
jgi:hypothetical protein